LGIIGLIAKDLILFDLVSVEITKTTVFTSVSYLTDYLQGYCNAFEILFDRLLYKNTKP